MNNDDQKPGETHQDPSEHVGPAPIKGRRRLRAVFAADVANFSGRVSVSETAAFGNVSVIIKIGREEIDTHDAQGNDCAREGQNRSCNNQAGLRPA